MCKSWVFGLIFPVPILCPIKKGSPKRGLPIGWGPTGIISTWSLLPRDDFHEPFCTTYP